MSWQDGVGASAFDMLIDRYAKEGEAPKASPVRGLTRDNSRNSHNSSGSNLTAESKGGTVSIVMC